ncbi:MAG TPA: hypothetical protein DCO86_01130 [Spirochaetaceae bacterium]|nr:hypothetical protein [Spirochaetaceae bacterium]
MSKSVVAGKANVINAHVHIYPDKIAQKAASSIGAFYGVHIEHDGTIASLLKENKEMGIDKCLVHSVATTVHQVASINGFIYEQTRLHDEFIGFMTLHPDMSKEEIKDEVDKCIGLGLCGVKLHPDCQGFYVDEKRAAKIYDAIAGKMPVLIHMGDARYDYSSVSRLIPILNDYEQLQVIAAHFGGYQRWDEVGLYHKAKHSNFHFDTSSSLYYLSKEKALGFIRDFGVEKFFFGTDFPMWPAKDELKRMDSLGLPDAEREMVMGKNLERFLRLP